MTTLFEQQQAMLAEGRLAFQRCTQCRHAWLPPREECPQCLTANWVWEDAQGDACLVSWVVYHTAYDDSVRDRLPYNVAVVELAEGPRLISNVLAPHAQLQGDMALRLEVEQQGGRWLARFVPANS